jgi:hypothetical protein
MMQFNIHDLETRRDWPLLVTAVPCRTCEAGLGMLCRDVGAWKLSGQTVTRADYHAERKYDAAEAWYNRESAPTSPVTPESSTPNQTTEQEDSGDILDPALAAVQIEELLSEPQPDPTPPEPPADLFAGGETSGGGAGGSFDDNPTPETPSS